MKLILFDGYCGLCNKFVDYVLKHDKNQIFKLTPIQGETAKKMKIIEHSYEVLEPDSVLLLEEDGRVYRRSDATLRILSQLSAMPWFYKSLLLAPRLIRDNAYNLVAQNRYRLFGRRDTCRLPTAAEKDRILP